MDKSPELTSPKEIKTPHKLHALAEQAREAADFDTALSLAYEASNLYLKEDNLPKAAEALCSATITLRHLFDNTRQEGYLLRAESDAQTALKLAKKSGKFEAEVIPNFNLAKVQEDMGKMEESVASYGRALDGFRAHPPKSHNRPAIEADINLHFLLARFKMGNHDVIGDISKQIDSLRDSKEVDYTKDVWLSGPYLKLASALRDTNPNQAHEYLREARLIIDANSQLVLRRNQWQRLADTFPPKQAPAG